MKDLLLRVVHHLRITSHNTTIMDCSRVIIQYLFKRKGFNLASYIFNSLKYSYKNCFTRILYTALTFNHVQIARLKLPRI